MEPLIQYLLVVFIATGLLTSYPVNGLDQDSMTPEFSLVKDLMANYNPNVRPVKNASEPIVVAMNIALNQIMDVTWNDYFLRWDESKYGGVKTINLYSKDVWVQDITLYTDVKGEFYETDPFRVILTSDGTVQWNIPTRLVSTCKLDVQHFPYDFQTCKLKFGSWTFGSNEIDLQNRTASADLAIYESNGEWDLVSVDAERHSILYNCCPEPYIDVTYYIKIKRKPLYYTFNVILPCIFIVIISPFSFLVSPGSGERIQLGITLLLSLTVYLLLVAEQLPVQSEGVPLISQYFMVTILTLVLANVASIISVHLYHRGSLTDTLPRRTKLVMRKVAQLVCKADGFDDAIDMRSSKVVSEDAEQENNVIKRLDSLRGYHVTSQRVEAIKMEWKMASLVLDRCLMFLSSVFITLCSLCFLLYKPNQD
ncbi:unnamed protein product [Owenia fusiformis]|uniref:Neuronal acetylcholine receptor subunit alpha-10-like n=1 Tax=Owenia fusiformis TaxID=6347 RepID=A0A8S4PHX8_OWEFU|nr:unnamed protein product [Owenia fusiformis]